MSTSITQSGFELLDLVNAMRRSELFNTVSPRTLAELILRARIKRFEPGPVLVSQGAPFDNYFLIMKGTVQITVAPPQRDDSIRSRYYVQAQDVLGEFGALMGSTSPGTATVVEEAIVFELSARHLRERIGLTRAFWRGAMKSLQDTPLSNDEFGLEVSEIEAALEGMALAEVFALRQLPGAGFDLEALADMLAKTQVADFGDTVARLQLGDTFRKHDEVYGGVVRYSVPRAQLLDVVVKLRPEYDYIFLPGESGIEEPMGEVPHSNIHLREYTGTKGEMVPIDMGGIEHQVIFIPEPDTFEEKIGARWDYYKSRHDLLYPIEGTDLSGLGHRLRLHIDPKAITEGWTPSTPLASLNPATLTALSRWARSVTQRRVGLALGGSGAWGYAHVALIRDLLARPAPVPIDVISGSSSGALIGAYFCAEGEAGMAKIVERGESGCIDLVVFLSIFSSYAIQALINCDLGHRRLEWLKVDFLPVCTNLTSGRFHTWITGPMGLAVRAAGSAPGVFTPTILGSNRLVDGCVTNNVPVDVLMLHADLLIASNAYPSTTRARHEHWCNGPVASFLRGIDPIGRILDLVVSGNLMLHTNGEFQSQDAAVTYDAGREDFPLFGAFNFGHAQKFIFDAQTNPRLRKSVVQAKAAWIKLSRPITKKATAPNPTPSPTTPSPP